MPRKDKIKLENNIDILEKLRNLDMGRPPNLVPRKEKWSMHKKYGLEFNYEIYCISR